LGENRDAIVETVNAVGVPTVYPWPEYVDEGGLMASGFDWPDQIRRAGAYVGRILNGEAIADLPVQASNKFNLILNLTTAREQGITFPPALLAIADERSRVGTLRPAPRWSKKIVQNRSELKRLRCSGRNPLPGPPWRKTTGTPTPTAST